MRVMTAFLSRRRMVNWPYLPSARKEPSGNLQALLDGRVAVADDRAPAVISLAGTIKTLTLGYPQESRGWKGFDTVLPRLAEGVRRITEYAAEKGVRTMVENHGRFVQDSDRVEKLP